MHLKGILAPLILYGVICLQLSERTCCSSHDIASDTHLLTGGRERERERRREEGEREIVEIIEQMWQDLVLNIKHSKWSFPSATHCSFRYWRWFSTMLCV